MLIGCSSGKCYNSIRKLKAQKTPQSIMQVRFTLYFQLAKNFNNGKRVGKRFQGGGGMTTHKGRSSS